jgi:oligoendopeptidase F
MGRAVKQSPGSENWWVYWSHIRDYFYVYSYASGLLIAKALQERVRADGSFMDKIKEFLAAGTSASPKEIFARMGIDIADRQFWDRGLDRIEQELSAAEQLAKKLKYKI